MVHTSVFTDSGTCSSAPMKSRFSDGMTGYNSWRLVLGKVGVAAQILEGERPPERESLLVKHKEPCPLRYQIHAFAPEFLQRHGHIAAAFLIWVEKCGEVDVQGFVGPGLMQHLNQRFG